MLPIFLILLLVVMAFWYVANEAPALFGVFAPVCLMRKRFFIVIVPVVALLTIFFSPGGALARDVSERFSFDSLDAMSLLIVILSSLITLSVLRRLSLTGVVAYAMMGALAAFKVDSPDFSGEEIFRYVLTFVMAPVIAAALSCLFSLILRMIFKGTRIHLVILSRYMKIAAIAVIVMMSVAVGLNIGGFMKGFIYASEFSSAFTVPAVCMAAILVVVPFLFLRADADEFYYNDFSIYNILSVGLATAITLTFFSFGVSASLLGLFPVPLSPVLLLAASVAGASVASGTHLVEANLYKKEMLSSALSPVGAFLLAYLLLSVSGNGERVEDFVVMTLAVILLLALYFFGYVRNQRNQREVTDRLVYNQQQQIYENARALNDMEVRVVMSENQALQNSVNMKRQEVMNVALSIVEQKEYLESLNVMVKKLSKCNDEQERESIISDLSLSIKQRLSYERDVDSQYFYAQAESLHEDFKAKLTENFPGLTQQEIRLSTLLRLGFSSKYIATLLNITPKSVEISRYRLRQKLGLDRGDNLVNFIKSI